LFTPATETITITSVPEGADVYWQGSHLGKTPLVTEIKKVSHTSSLVLEKTGYESRAVMLGREINGVAFLNLGFITTTSGAPSWGLDIITGRMWTYQPNKYVTKLERSSGSAKREEAFFNYVMMNAEKIRIDLARGYGDEVQNLCGLLEKTPEECALMRSKLYGQREQMISAPDSLALYQAIAAL
jgi:hypothetical protein